MAITRATNPVDDSEIVMITGKIDRIIIKEAEKTSKNIEYNTTHLASLLIEGVYVNYIALGIKEGKEPNIAINTGTKDSPKWVQIQETDEVKVIVTEKVVGDKTYYSAKRTGIKLVKKNATPGQQSQQQVSNTSSAKQPFDQEGTATGHAVNGAFNFILSQGVEPTNENIIKYGKLVHKVTEQINTEFKEKYEKASKNYKAMTGNSILNACKFADANNFEESLFNLAIDFLDNVVPEIAATVKGEAKPAPAVKTTRAVPAKKNATKAKPVVEEEVFPELEDEDDSSLPF